MRSKFDENAGIPDKILADNAYFQDFKLTFAKLESGKQHPLTGKKYMMLNEAKRGSFELMPIRCMSIRQNQPENDNVVNAEKIKLTGRKLDDKKYR